MSTFVNRIRKYFEKPVYQHLLFAFATIATICMVGYHFGTMDQVSHIPFLKKTVDPNLYPGDAYFDLRLKHYSYFWLLFIPFYKLGILEISMFIGHIVVTYCTFWALWRLTQTLFKDNFVSVLVTLGIIYPHVGFAGFTILEFSILNRTFVLPFLLTAINLYLKRKYYGAFILLGIMYNLHVISVNFVMAMIMFDMLIRYKKIGISTIAKNIVLFLTFALPVLLWKFGNSNVGLTADWEWYSILTRSIFSHMFYFFAPFWYVWIFTLGGISAILLFFIANKTSSSYSHIIKNFILAAVIVLFVEGITAIVYPVTILIQSQIIRIGVFILIFCYIFFANYILQQFESKKISFKEFCVLILAYIFSPSPIILLLIWGTQRIIKTKHLKFIVSLALLIILFTGITIITIITDLWKPEIHIYPKKDDYYAAQLWAKNNTPRDTVFISPPHSWWFYDTEWRVLSERSSVVTLSELLEGAFDPEYIGHWKPRFEDVAPGALKKFDGNIFENIETTKKAYYSLDSKDMSRIAKKYNATYLVVESAHHYDFPLAYQNKTYKIYRLR